MAKIIMFNRYGYMYIMFTCISNEGIGSTSIKQEECRVSSSKEGYVLEGLWSLEYKKQK